MTQRNSIQFSVDRTDRGVHYFTGLDTAAKSSEKQKLQPVLRLRPSCAGITFKGRVDFAMEQKEQWKPIVGYEGLYEVSDLGRVRAMFDNWNGRYKAGRIIKPQRNSNGYLKVGLYYPGANQFAKQRTIHTLVLEAFNGPRPPGKEVRHKDGVRQNNRHDNLIWGTRKENMQDAIGHGTTARGERCNFSKLSEAEVLEIRSLRNGGMAAALIAIKFKISKPHVWRISRLKTWSHLTER